MKKTSRILAILLTLVMLVGMALVMASAKAPSSTTTLGYEYDYDGLSVGSASPNLLSGAGSASNYSTNLIASSPDGNKYVRFAYKAETSSAKYRRDLDIGKYANTDSASLTHLSDYSYFTVDFDLSADMYSVFVGYDVQTS